MGVDRCSRAPRTILVLDDRLLSTVLQYVIAISTGASRLYGMVGFEFALCRDSRDMRSLLYYRIKRIVTLPIQCKKTSHMGGPQSHWPGYQK